MKEPIKGFRVTNINNEGFIRYSDNDEVLLLGKGKKQLPNDLAQMFLTQGVHQYQTAYDYCKSSADYRGHFFENIRKVPKKGFIKRIANTFGIWV